MFIHFAGLERIEGLREREAHQLVVSYVYRCIDDVVMLLMSCYCCFVYIMVSVFDMCYECLLFVV